MLFTRLQRSASSAIGNAPKPTVRDTTDSNAPSSLSDRFHSAFSAGNIETTICRSMKSNTMIANVSPNTYQA